MIITLLPSQAALRAFPRPRCSSIRSTIQCIALLRSHSSLSIRQTWERTYRSACEHTHHHPINAYQLFTFANILLCGVFLGPLSSCLQVLLIVVAVNYRDFVVLHWNHKILVPEGRQEQHRWVTTEWSGDRYLNSLLRSNDLWECQDK